MNRCCARRWAQGGYSAGVAVGVGRPEPRLTWVDPEFLAERGVRPWSGERSLPLGLPSPAYAGFLTHDAAPALAAGLTTRPLSETAADTLRWMTEHPDEVRDGGLDPVTETEVLREWHARATAGS